MYLLIVAKKFEATVQFDPQLSLYTFYRWGSGLLIVLVNLAFLISGRGNELEM